MCSIQPSINDTGAFSSVAGSGSPCALNTYMSLRWINLLKYVKFDARLVAADDFVYMLAWDWPAFFMASTSSSRFLISCFIESSHFLTSAESGLSLNLSTTLFE